MRLFGPDALLVRQFLLPDKRHKFVHFLLGLYRRHILLYRQVFASQKAVLLATIHVQRGESVQKEGNLTVVIISLYQNSFGPFDF